MLKALLQLANFTLGPDATINTETDKNSVRIKAPNPSNNTNQKWPQPSERYAYHFEKSDLAGCKSAFNPAPTPTPLVNSTDRSKAMVLVFFLFFVALCGSRIAFSFFSLYVVMLLTLFY